MLMPLFLSSLVLGIAYCAPPGIITAETIRRGFVRGFWPALMVQMGSLVGDMTWALIAVTGAAFVVQNTVARIILSLLGIILLLFLAWNALQDARHSRLPQAGKSNSIEGDFATGAILSLTNPYAVAFWAGVGSTVIMAATPNPQWFHFATFFLAFLIGAILWCLFLSGLVAWGRQWLRPGFFRWVNLICGLFLGFFALQLLWTSLQIFL
jgi:chemosensory pili system protein ChpE